MKTPSTADGFTGSASCRECHAKFYELWDTSHHAKAMQPFTPELATDITTMPESVTIKDKAYQYGSDETGGWVTETFPDGTSKKHLIAYTLGGKNMYNFMTLLERGRLQILPLAYDRNDHRWFDNTSDMLIKRHFSEEEAINLSLDWTDRQWAFNTACFDCHVSQLKKNYDVETDSYMTEWGEPGIGCETCHGPGEEHIRVCKEAGEGNVPKDLKLLRWKEDMNAKQRDESCAACHAKHQPISDSFEPSDRFFDHYDLTAYENTDYFADGRDDGENYTYTLWLANPCMQAGELECTYCHTSSGRFRFKDEPNKSCLPCHAQRVANVEKHSHHAKDSKGSQCNSCHMPMTRFTSMNRSDHSFRPPTPATTIEFNSPNACNLCHKDKDAQWADKNVREWHGEHGQDKALKRGHMIKSAREDDWRQLPEILAYMETDDCGPVTTVSLLRLLPNCQNPDKWPAILKQADDKDPWVRSAAAFSLTYEPTPETTDLLLGMLTDDFRVVRHRATEALLARGFARTEAAQTDTRWTKAVKEYEGSLGLWADRWSSHFNKGIFYENIGKPQLALDSYEKSISLRDDVAGPLINAAMSYARQGNMPKATTLITKALKAEPENAMVNVNAGLLEAELGDIVQAEKHFRAALAANPGAAQAAFNLGIMLCNRGDTDEGLEMARTAMDRDRMNPRYLNTYAYYLNHTGATEDAIELLKEGINTGLPFGSNYFLLGSIYEQQKKYMDALKLYDQAAKNLELAPQERNAAMQAKARVQQQLSSLLQ